MKDGSTYPPLEFRNVEDFVDLKDILLQYLTMNRSANDPGLFLLKRYDPEAFQKSIECLGLYPDSSSSRAASFSNPRSLSLEQKLPPKVSTTSSRPQDVLWPPFSQVTATVSNVMRSVRPAVQQQFSPNVAHMRELIKNDYHQLGLVQPVEISQIGDVMHSSGTQILSKADDDSDFEVITKTSSVKLPPLKVVSRGDIFSVEDWHSHLDPEGRVMNVSALKEKIFHGCIDPEIRSIVWKYLLGYFQWDLTESENKSHRKKLKETYFTMKQQWMTMTDEQIKRNALFRERKNLIDKDVHRTDRGMRFFKEYESGNLTILSDILMTYVTFHHDLGYVQGMNDLLAPILTLMTDEVDSFWCFVGLMNRMEKNFECDQVGIKKQFTQLFDLLQVLDWDLSNYLVDCDAQALFFTFRWLLVHFKREFQYCDIMNLWEVLWTDHLAGANFHLFVAAAILIDRHNDIIENQFGFNEILKFVNDLTYKIDVQQTLRKAVALYYQLWEVRDKLSPDMRATFSLTL